jgi:hypothetical protein
MVLSNINSGDPKTEHELEGGSRVKFSYSYVESFLLDSRVGVLGMSVAQNLSLELLEGRGLCSSEGDGICSVSQASLGETNGDMNFTSSNMLWLGCYYAFGFSGLGIGVAEAAIPNFSSRLP